jgi:cell division protein FtsB
MTATIKQLEERNMFVERRIKQLEERNMFLERRHENCTGKLEELLREQRKTEENDA